MELIYLDNKNMVARHNAGGTAKYGAAGSKVKLWVFTHLDKNK